MNKKKPIPPKERGSFIETERYASLDRNGKLIALFREMGRYIRFRLSNKSGQSQVLWILDDDGCMTQRSLTEHMRIQPGSVSEILGKMEAAGLISRTVNPDDRRTTLVDLTESGRREAKRLHEEWDRRVRETFRPLTEEEADSLMILLEKLYYGIREKNKGDDKQNGGEQHVEIC